MLSEVGRRPSQRLSMTKMQQEENNAAATLQAIQRGRRSRRIASRTATTKKARERASLVLQSKYRSKKATENVQQRRLMHQASSKIGALYRDRLTARTEERKKRGPRALDREDIVRGLHSLGRSASTLRHVFLGLTVTEARLDDLAAIAAYPHLESVDLSKNDLKSLEALGKLPHLTGIDVSDNRLTAVLDIDFPHCTAEGAWAKGRCHVGSQVVVADFSRNQVEVVGDGLARHKRLKCLFLDGNLIRAMGSAFRGLGRLMTLSLNANQIGHISGLEGLDALADLSLDDNRLRFLDNLDYLPRLRRLSVAGNQLTSLAGLDRCAALHTLDAARNLIPDVRDMRHLADLPFLAVLSLKENPCASLDVFFYRRRVLVRLLRLTLLDDLAVTSEEKVKSVNINGGVESDLAHRQATYKKYFGPEAAFEDTLPPCCEALDLSPRSSLDASLQTTVNKLVHRALQPPAAQGDDDDEPHQPPEDEEEEEVAAAAEEKEEQEEQEEDPALNPAE